jgi:hypothetical protein
MSRPRDPFAIQKLKGVHKKNPKRMRLEQEGLRGLGDPPPNLSDAEREIWRELLSVIPAGVLARSDRFLVEAICILTARLRGGGKGLSAGETHNLCRMLSLCGMTPVDRSKVVVKKP